MKRLLIALALATSAFAQYNPPGVNGSAVTVNGGALTFTLAGVTTLSLPSSGDQTAVLGGENIATTNCVIFATSTTGRVNCSSGFTWNNSGSVVLTNSGSPIMTVKNSGANQTAFFEWQNASGRQWLFGTGLPGSSNTGLAYAEYTNGSFIGIPFYLKKGGTVCVGIGNSECTSGTLTVKDATATTGATRAAIQLGAADSATTATLTNAGTTKSAGYQSSDGSPGVTGATCTAWKNGLCTTL